MRFFNYFFFLCFGTEKLSGTSIAILLIFFWALPVYLCKKLQKGFILSFSVTLEKQYLNEYEQASNSCRHTWNLYFICISMAFQRKIYFTLLGDRGLTCAIESQDPWEHFEALWKSRQNTTKVNWQEGLKQPWHCFCSWII